MAYKKKTLRQLRPLSRRIAKTVSLAQSLNRTLRHLVDEVNLLEKDRDELLSLKIFCTEKEKLKDKAI